MITSLVKKPGAFARYRYRESLFPAVTFRQAYDTLAALLGERADVEYVRILHLAARTSESRVEQVLVELMGRGELKGYGAVRELVREEAPPVPTCQIAAVDLKAYDLCLQGGVQ